MSETNQNFNIVTIYTLPLISMTRIFLRTTGRSDNNVNPTRLGRIFFFFLESEPQKSFSVGIRSRNFPKALRARPEYLENHSVLHSKVCALAVLTASLCPLVTVTIIFRTNTSLSQVNIVDVGWHVR